MCAAIIVQASTNRDASPPHPEGSFERAFDAHLKGALDGAVAGYQEFVAAQPTHVDAWGNLCIALCDLGRAEEAGTPCAWLDIDNALTVSLMKWVAGSFMWRCVRAVRGARAFDPGHDCRVDPKTGQEYSYSVGFCIIMLTLHLISFSNHLDAYRN